MPGSSILHREILTKEQIELFPFLRKFREGYTLVGGTAIALHIGHRRSIDFDLFTPKAFRSSILQKKIKTVVKIDRILVDKESEFTFFVGGVKITFLNYPFELERTMDLDKTIKMPDLLTLSAMKAYALGKRAKWKDYVDLYFILKNYYSLHDVIKKCEMIFGNEFNSKIFRTQLSYFDDVNYEEAVEFLPGFEIDGEKIKKELINFSLEN